jgi:DNA replication protein DnaC
MKQCHDDSLVDWQRRVLAADRPTIGISLENRKLAAELYKWTPRDGSVWVEGPPGAGKSLLLQAKANDLLATPRTWTEQEHAIPARMGEGYQAAMLSAGRGKRLVPSGGYSVAYFAEPDLFAAQRAHARGVAAEVHDDEPAARAARSTVCILDDLGSTSEIKAWHTDLLFRVIDLRYRDNKPVLMTSNIELPKLAERYGERLVNRLAEMVGDRRFVLRDMCWRTAGTQTERPRGGGA